MKQSVASEIANYAYNISYNDLSTQSVHAAKRAIIDVLGCAIGASNQQPIRIAKDALGNIRAISKSSTVLGTKIRTSPDIAAFINGLSARYFDYNDSYEAKEFAHPSDNILPLIAVAESANKSGEDLITAIVLAYEVQCRLCDSASIWRRGWDHVVYGLVSVSAASSKLMGLEKGKIAQSINIALNGHIAMRQVRAGELSMWKAASFSNAARNAIFSAMLASRGMTGPSPIFEGEMGLWNQVSGNFSLNTMQFGNKTNSFKITHNIMKYFPAEIRSQSAISAALNARKSIKSIKDIVSIEIRTTESGYKILGKDIEKWRPKTKETADHSLPYVVAVALVDGKVDIQSYSPIKLKNKIILGIMKKTKVVEDKDFTSMYPKSIPNEVILKLKDGKIIKEKVIYQKGHSLNPMSDAEIEDKFNTLTKPFIDQKYRKEMLAKLWKVDQIKKIEDILPKYQLQ